MRLPELSPLTQLEPEARAVMLAKVLHAELVQHQESCLMGKSSTIPPLLESLADVLSESLAIVRSLANASAPISRLPNEILSAIFEWVPKQAEDAPRIATFGCFRSVDVRDAIPLTAVSRWWRQVALATPSLWSTVCNPKVPQVVPQYSLHTRCAGGALTVFCDNHTSDYTLGVLRTRGDRVTQLYALGSRSLAALQAPDMSLPHLEHCIVQCASADVSVSRLPLFAGESVRLRLLTLHSVSFLPSEPFPSLTHLMISKPTRRRSGALYAIGDLLDFISGSPLLRELHLYRLAHSGVEPTMVGLPALTELVRLARLEKLCVLEMQHSNPYPQDAKLVRLLDALLPRVHIPDTCAVRIGQLRPSDLGKCLGYLSSSRRATRMCVESVSLSEAHYHQRRSLVLADPEHAHYTRLDVSLLGLSEGGYLFYLLRALPLPIFQDVQELYVDTTSAYGWPSEVFGALPRLEVLAIRPVPGESTRWNGTTRCAKDFVGALEVTESSKAVSCPRLSILVCGARVPGEGENENENEHKDEAYLRRLAGSRENAGYPLRRLLVWQAAGESVQRAREYSGDGDFVRGYEGEEAAALAWRAWSTPAPSGCPDWMEEQMYHPSITV